MLFGKHINKFYLKYWYLLLVGIIALLFVNYFQLEIPKIIGSIADGLNNIIKPEEGKIPLTVEALKDFMLQIIGIAAIMFTGRFLWRINIFTLGVKVESDLRDEMFCHSEKLSREYFNTHKVGEEMALYTNDLQTIRMSFGSGTIMIVDSLFLGVLTFYYMFRLDSLLAIISLVPLVLIMISSLFVGRILKSKFQKRQEAFAALSDFTQENFSGITVVKGFVKEEKELERFAVINTRNKKHTLTFVRYSMLLNILIGLLLNAILLIIVLYSGYSAAFKGNFTIGKLSQFLGYYNTLIWPMMAIGQLINIRSQGSASLKRINAMLDHEVEIHDEDVVDVEIKGNITFKNLSFKYPGAENYSLRNIDLEIKQGMSVGVLGRTGSGKTTFSDTLLRLYNLEKGTLIIDGVDIMNIGLKNLRANIGYVPQDNFLFSKTINDNICFGLEENDLEKAKEYAGYAAVASNIEDFPEQYDTILGERGVTLSGGQRQRISIARAMIKNPPILILDDSVSAVDTETEKTILHYLQETRKDKTTILIAHRISTVKDLDLIVVLDEGKIIACGTHLELLQNSKVYQDMVLLQQLDEEEGVSHE